MAWRCAEAVSRENTRMKEVVLPVQTVSWDSVPFTLELSTVRVVQVSNLSYKNTGGPLQFSNEHSFCFIFHLTHFISSDYHQLPLSLSGVCQQGRASETGLEPCLPCPIGHFQPFMGQKFCFQCPKQVKSKDIIDQISLSIYQIDFTFIKCMEVLQKNNYTIPLLKNFRQEHSSSLHTEFSSAWDLKTLLLQ